VRRAMTKRVTGKHPEDVITKTTECLKNMRAALIHQIKADSLTGQGDVREDCMDSGDLASEAYEREMSSVLSQRERNKIAEIDEALRRIGRPSYGVCEMCGYAITEQRLKAIPFARLCCDCQRDQERDAKTRQRGNGVVPERFDDFASILAESEIYPERIRKHGNGTIT
jgi:DnaK suppressor protein